MPDTDDIFVTTDMLNGPYHWDQDNLPEDWEGTFSFWSGDGFNEGEEYEKHKAE